MEAPLRSLGLFGLAGILIPESNPKFVVDSIYMLCYNLA
jgi:hypothetical protein